MTAAAAVGIIALSLALAGCTAPDPPAPTPTSMFSTEEEAFAAAEATYRAYVDALNQVDLSDPETFEALFGWTDGELNALDRRQFSEWHAQGLRKTGEARVRTVAGTEWDAEAGLIQIDACYDVSDVDLRDAQGISIVSTERPPEQELAITLTSAHSTPTGLAVLSISTASGGPTC